MPALTSNQERGLAALDNKGWVLVEYLESQLGIELMSQAFGLTDSYITRNMSFTRVELQKLQLLGRITAAFKEIFPRNEQLRAWLFCCHPSFGEDTPIRVIARLRVHERPVMTWKEVEERILTAVRIMLS